MTWIICGAVAIVLILAFWVRMWAGRRRRVKEVRHIIEMVFSSVAARKRLLKALWYFHDLWRPSWFESRKAHSFEQGLRDTLKRFEVSPGDQNQGLGDIIEVSIPENLFDVVSNRRLRRELRIVIDAAEQTLVIEAPEAAEPERHYREERVN